MQPLRWVWAEPSIDAGGARVWREVNDRPSPAALIASPDAPEARYRTKRRVEGVGYQVHRTATGAEETPQVIVKVATTPATPPDDTRLDLVQASLAPRERWPAEPVVDQGDPDADGLVASQWASDVAIVGPVAEAPSGQARADDGFDTSPCLVDGDRRLVTCPAGQSSLAWLPNT